MKKLLNIKIIGRYPLSGRGSGSVAKITIHRICTGKTELRRSLQELINTEDPGWPLAQEWVAAARNHVEVLEVTTRTLSFPGTRAERAQAFPEAPLQHFSAQEAVWLFVRDHSDLEKAEQSARVASKRDT